MNFTEFASGPKEGRLEIIVTNHYTGEILLHDEGHNQLQDWTRQAWAYLCAGRLFSTWGNHGESISDIGPYTLPYTIKHYKDGCDGSVLSDIVTESPWTYSSLFSGLIQTRSSSGVDDDLATVSDGAKLYPFFPTKMRFGTGGLDSDKNPKTGISTAETDLQSSEIIYPFVLVDRTRSTNQHISLSSSTSGSTLTNNKVTFSCKLPGGDPNYPYNGLVISEAGLYCDAAMIVGGSDTFMRTGTMIAYRTFYGITKNEDIDIQFNWNLIF